MNCHHLCKLNMTHSQRFSITQQNVKSLNVSKSLKFWDVLVSYSYTMYCILY